MTARSDVGEPPRPEPAEDFPEAVVDELAHLLHKPRARGWIHVYSAVVAAIAGAVAVTDPDRATRLTDRAETIAHTITDPAQQARALAERLRVRGLMNVQMAWQDDALYVIEVNPRASRTVPFVSKAIGTSLAKIAAKVMMGKNLQDLSFTQEIIPNFFSVKEAVFPFNKFPSVDPILSPEMKSTGEAIRFIKNLRDPYFRQLYKDRSMYLSK